MFTVDVQKSRMDWHQRYRRIWHDAQTMIISPLAVAPLLFSSGLHTWSEMIMVVSLRTSKRTQDHVCLDRATVLNISMFRRL